MSVVQSSQVNNNSHKTFFSIRALSTSSVFGTGTPHVKSLVTGLGLSPPLTRESIISPSLLITEFGLHLPSFQDRLIHSSSFGWTRSSRTYMCAESRVVTLCVRSTRQRGLIRSVGSRVLAQPSHWSPRASYLAMSSVIPGHLDVTYIVSAMGACTLNKPICQES